MLIAYSLLVYNETVCLLLIIYIYKYIYIYIYIYKATASLDYSKHSYIQTDTCECSQIKAQWLVGWLVLRSSNIWIILCVSQHHFAFFNHLHSFR